MAQAPQPFPFVPQVDGLLETAKATANEIHRTLSLLIFISLRKRGTLGALLAAALHLAAALLQSYLDEVIPVNIGTA